jgi:hypothetical protein
VNVALARSKREREKNRPRQMSWPVFVTHYAGLTPWVPPCVCPSLIPASSDCVPTHISLERGGVGAAAVHSAQPGVLVVEPTSLNRGEGLVAGLLSVDGRVLRCRG